jgi:glutamyl-Q tRNA(Asp) synthetase
MAYRGRFAPSPTGALHAGSLVAALASWLDARAHNGAWLVRIEDVDTPRCIPGADQLILQQLAACGLASDEPVVYQSQRGARYQQALDQLVALQAAYPCACSRKDIEAALATRGDSKPRHGELVYPGTCRDGLHGKTARAWRFKTDFFEEKQQFARMESAQSAIESVAHQSRLVDWQDRRLGTQQQDVAHEVGDFVLQRADGLWAYQLAVVVDDAAQGITDIVRGQDLADNTPRQMLLQRALGLPHPRYLHTPLVLAADGQKLSKQTGAQPIDTATPAQALQALQTAATALGLPCDAGHDMNDGLQAWVAQWRETYNQSP